MPSATTHRLSLDGATLRSTSDRRHTEDFSSLATPPLSRSGSVTSVTSHKSEPARRSSTATGQSRSSSIVSTSTIDSQASVKSSGFMGLFGKSKGDKPKKEKKDVDKIVLTSRHAAAVKTKIMLDPKFQAAQAKPKPPTMVGTQNSQHLTAEQQEMRHPHSGPPALHAASDHMDMPILTRIVSGDERDEEDELDKAREVYLLSKMSGLDMRKVSEHQDAEEDIAEGEVVESRIMEKGGTRFLGASLSDHERPHTHRQKTPIGGRWNRDEHGKWTR